ncbi:MAG: hypothetical protein Q8L81_05165 [Bacteroidota bacterium]|nr:hypothetical protein [Bacteroidota bacterium]
METIKNKKIIFFVLLCCSFCFANALVLKEDSLKFDITDPRNPKCPCHKFQKLADDEYRKLLGEAIKVKTDNTNSNYSNTFSGKNEINSKNSVGTKKFRSKKWNHSFFNFKKKKGAKKRGVRRLRRDNTTCYHF